LRVEKDWLIDLREEKRMKPARLFAVLGLLLAVLLVPALGQGVSAQDASPAAGGTPMGGCVAPELPPGTPTAASPVAGEGEEGMDMEAEAPPVAEGPASRNIAEMGQAALDNIVSCLNSGNWAGAAALMTPNMLMFAGGSDNPYDVVASFEAEPPAPMDVVNVSDPIIDTNNRIGMTVVFSGLFNGPGVQAAEKWYFVREGDHLKLDEIVPTQLPADLYPDATIVNVQMVDYAFALDMNTVPAGPVVFNFSNTSFSGAPHVGVTVTLTEGITAEDVISGDVLPEDQMTGFVNALFLEPGQSASYYVEDLAAGTYTLVCDVTTADGTPHWQLGMVAQFTVE
jgi:uncharacterized cupredoxin-like copper-binding protein